MACRVAKTLCMSFFLVSAFTLCALESSYTIKEGETLTSVARRVEVPVDVLTIFNGISDPGKLRAGTVLRVPPVHAVRKGETLYGIARDYSDQPCEAPGAEQAPGQRAHQSRLKALHSDGNRRSRCSANRRAVRGKERAEQDDRAGDAARAPSRRSRVAAPGRHEEVKGKISGLVFYGARGDPVYSAAAGEVKWVAPYWGLGKVVLIKSQDGSIFSYWGNEEILVNVGDRVNPGTEIARIGDSPQGGGAKLYFSIKDAKGQIVDPEKYFSEKSQA